MNQDDSNEWVIFLDTSYYDMWTVRRKGDTNFNSPQTFHFPNKEDAELMKALLEKAIMAKPTA